MDIYLFQPERYERMYNCNLYQVDQISLEQRQHVGLGLTWIGLTTFCQFLYLPCMFSIYKHIDNPCYALMFYIGLVDMITLIMNGWITGYFGIIGMMFCMSPKLNYLLSCYGLSCWFAESVAEIILAFNRCLELWSSEKAAKLFSGKKIWIWIALPTIYGIGFGCFSRAFAFNSLYFSWFSYPHAGYLEATDISEYLNVAHSIHNHVILIALFLIYLIFCILLLFKSKASGHSDSGPTFSQKKIFFQVMVISGINATAASIFVYMQYFQLSPFIIILGSFCWLCAHGLPPTIYLLMNKTIRKDCQRMLLGFLGRDYNPTNTIHPSADLSRISKRIVMSTTKQGQKGGETSD